MSNMMIALLLIAGIALTMLGGCAEPQGARYVPPYVLRHYIPHDDVLDAPVTFQELFPHKPMNNPDNWT